MATLLIPVLFCIVGALIYGYSGSNPKLAELGRLTFWAGIFALALLYGGGRVTLP